MDLHLPSLVLLGNPLRNWVSATLLLTAVIIVIRLLRTLSIRKLRGEAQETHVQWRTLVVDLLSRVRAFAVFLVALYAASLMLSLPDRLEHIIKSLAIVAILLQGALWGNRIIGFWLARFAQERGEQDSAGRTTISVLGFLARAVLWTILFLLVLDNFGFKITGLITGLGIGGIAVALAAQELLKDLFASLAIVLDKPFLIGDFIIIDTYMGKVQHVGIKTTRILSLSGEELVFSNSDILSSRMRNFGRMMERRVVLNIGVTYQTSVENVEAGVRIIREIIESIECVRFDRAHFRGFGESALLLEAVYYVLSPDHATFMDRQQDVDMGVLRRFREEGIEFAYPTQTVLLEGGPAPAGVQPLRTVRS